MKTRRSIFFAFILNLFFSVFEFFGGIFTGSVAIISDSVHDLGDAVGIGCSYFLERKSNRPADDRYTFGYKRFSVLGGVVTVTILLIGCGTVIYTSVRRLISPVRVNYDGMIIFAVVGVIVNGLATFLTHKGHSINQRAVNLHMLEDVLGWVIVLVGAVVMRFTDLYILDPVLSIIASALILTECIKCIAEILNVFLIKTPREVDPDGIRKELGEAGVTVHGLRIMSLDGEETIALCKVSGSADKEQIRSVFGRREIFDVTIEVC